MKSFEKFLVAIFLVAATAWVQGDPAEGKKLKYVVRGTAFPDNDFCYSAPYYDQKTDEELGEVKDCVTSIPVVLPDGSQTFQVETIFTPNDECEEVLQTTCEVTVTPDTDDDLEDPFVATEACNNKIDGIIQPSGLNGEVKLRGKVDNTKFPELTFELNWDIKIQD